MTLARLKWPNVTKSATQLVAAAMTPRPCGPRNRAVMTVPIIAPSIQYAFVPPVSVTAFHNRISGDHRASRAKGGVHRRNVERLDDRLDVHAQARAQRAVPAPLALPGCAMSSLRSIVMPLATGFASSTRPAR